MKKIIYTILILMLCAVCAQANFRLWQLPNCTTGQIMSYVIQTQHGKIIVIDGGSKYEAEYLKNFVNERGGVVDMWFLTHHHNDHTGAFVKMQTFGDKPKIKRVYASLPSEDFLNKYEPNCAFHLTDILNTEKKYNIHIEDLTAGTTFVIDGITIEVLRVKNENITANAGNNTSCVFRIGDAGRKILFLGDLGVEGGRELLASPYAKWLKADYVQMAHHGQAGVEKDVYAAIGAKICLWTTPLSKNSAEWQNFKTKKWMAELGATKDYVMSDGLLEIK